MTPLMQRCIEAARAAKACDAGHSDDASSATICMYFCGACAANVVRAVAEELLLPTPGTAWAKQTLATFQAVRRALEGP
mgnify:CR=1 FL=1